MNYCIFYHDLATNKGGTTVLRPLCRGTFLLYKKDIKNVQCECIYL